MDDGKRISTEVEDFLRDARAGNLSKVHDALNAKPDLINTIEAGGFAALHFAAFSGNISLIEILLGFKPDVNLKNYDGNTPLVMAVKGKQHDAIRTLVNAGADINMKLNRGATALHHAAAMGYNETVGYLVSLGAVIDFSPSEGGSVLHWACHSGKISCVGYVLYEFSFPVNILDKHGGTPMYVALHCKQGEVAEFLLEHGADPNVAAADGSTPLHFAVESGTLDDVKTLIAFGANPDAKDAEGKTPKDIATEKSKKDSLKELLKPALTKEKRVEDSLRFKEQGNKVFGAGESVKAAKFYSKAISLDPTNHVFFSNRSACYFNSKRLEDAYFDSLRCLALSPKFVRGYFRKAATLNAMGRQEEAAQTIEAGMKLDPKNADLITLKNELKRKK